MITRFNILKQKINSYKFILHVLLRFKKPTDTIVVICSQHLDEYIVEYQKINIKGNSKKHIA